MMGHRAATRTSRVGACRSQENAAMRKLFFALATMLFMAGLVIAAEVTVVSYDKEAKSVKVKEGDAEKTYKFAEKVKITVTTKDKDGNETSKDGTFEDLERRLGFAGKGGK